ncbi:NADP-dependent oxidoreductase [Paenibacillus polysaccharolyticus]|uniref:NADP-dependent oxidoreductase n=1 Tax=Paenibacillus TaxID=44249 RepID=UPI0020A14121|nr:NADP-dependent oxidoreductase [Paenibacillus polysaccharolyticus]MCP1133622.1 NADP-dependent oxidoreductase [Paenibacillus polysaccharolyticus]
MRVVGMNDFGGPDKLKVFDIKEVHPGPGEVRIRVHAASVNPVDIAFRSGQMGGFAGRSRPLIPGKEAAGVISEVGSGVKWQVGDRVMAIASPFSPYGGAYADEVVVPAEHISRIPEGLDFAAASTLPMNGVTAHTTLDQLNLAPGQTLAVTGAAGIVGGYIIQLAKKRGLRVIADASAEDEQLVRDLGADEVVRRGEEIGYNIRKLVPDGVDGLADSAAQMGAVVPAVRDNGRIAFLRPWPGQPGRGIFGEYVSLTSYYSLRYISEEVEKGILTPRVADIFPAEQAYNAHLRFESKGVRGRLVLDFSK